MNRDESTPVDVPLAAGDKVSALIDAPANPDAVYVFAHGAGAGMTHPFMAAMARALADRGIAVLRYQFPYMEAGGKRPDRAPVAQATVRAAVVQVARRWPATPLYAGGKSFGARMTSQAQAASALERVQGLVFVGFPLHPAGAPSMLRARHLADVQLPMLFLQGTRDALADLDLMRRTVRALGERATLHPIDDADHAFHVPVRSGRRDADVVQSLADAMADWMRGAGRPGGGAAPARAALRRS